MKVLVADDDPISLLLLQDALQDWGYEVLTASDGPAALTHLQAPDGPVLAVIDWIMPGMNGLQICEAIRSNPDGRYVYLIMLTSKRATEHIVEAIDAGADDFISKPFANDELQARLRAGKRVVRLEQELRIRATRDALTGIYNRGEIIHILQREIARHAREKSALALIFADLDHFKTTNDTYGHLAGDDVLREIARRIATVLRPYDSLGRYGGEELLIVLPSCDHASVKEVAERVRAVIAGAPVDTDVGAVPTTLSVGVAIVEHDRAMTVKELLYLADAALYKAKENGRNRVEFAPAYREQVAAQDSNA